MSELYLEKVSFEINGIKIATDRNLVATGMCSLSISSDADILKEATLLFSKTHMYSSNEIQIDGNVRFDGELLPASKLHVLLNPYVIFSGRETVEDLLLSVNKKEASSLIKKLGISFSKKQIRRLSPEQSRIFEVAVNLASKPKVIYLKRIDMQEKIRIKCFDLLRDHLKANGGIVIIETEFTDQFDSAIVIRNDSILSFDKNNARKFFNSHKTSIFNFSNAPPVNYPEISYENFNTSNEGHNYDYKKLYKRYGTENIIDIKQKSIRFWKRMTSFGIFRIKLQDAIRQGFRRYEIAYRRKEPKIGIIKSLAPCFYNILLLRLLQILNDNSLICEIPNLITYAISVYFGQIPLKFLVLFFFKNFVIQEFSLKRAMWLFHHFLRSEISNNALRILLACICFSIFYNYSSIFDEESQLINYSMNILTTPGTLVFSILTFIFFTHGLTFLAIGYIFNIKHTFITVISASFTNLFISSFTGKRLRVSIIGFFMTVFFLITLANMLNYDVLMMNYFYILLFPCVAIEPSLIEGLSELKLIAYSPSIYFYLYCAISYLVCCYSLSFK